MPQRRFLSREAFAAGAEIGGSRSALAKALPAEIKAEGEPESRSLRFTISTGVVDRYGDTIDPAGWKLEQFRQNPVVLWAHDGESLPVARADQVWIEDGSLKANATFPPAELSPFADKVFRFLTGGFLFATSVGFLPLKWAWVDDPSRRFGIDFLEQELLEFSIVSVPANPEALLEESAPPATPKAAPAPWRRTIERARLGLRH